MTTSNTVQDVTTSYIDKGDYLVENLNVIKPFVDTGKILDLSDDAEVLHWVKNCTKLVRVSHEYRRYISYLKEHLEDMRHCAFQTNVKNGMGGIVIEAHHSPYKLADIIEVVIFKHMCVFGELDEFSIVDEVVKLHYAQKVGLIPLSKSFHKAVHENIFEIHPVYVKHGDWKKFTEEYYQYFPERLVQFHEDLKKWDGVPYGSIPEVLKTKYTIVRYEGYTLYRKCKDLLVA
jgi:hypothetical protein